MTYLSQATVVGWCIADGTPLYFPTFNVDFDPAEFDVVDNGHMVGKTYPSAPYHGGERTSISFSTYLFGASSGTEIPASPLLEACGMAADPAVIVTSQDFTLADDLHLDQDLKAADIVAVYDGVKYVIDEAVGNVVIDCVAGQLPVLNFNFIGVGNSTPLAILAMPSLTTTNIQNPVPVKAAAASCNPAGEGAITTLVVNRYMFDLGNILDPRPDVSGSFGYTNPIVSGNAPTLTVELEYPVPTGGSAIIDFEDRFRDRDLCKWTFEHGGTLGANQQLTFSFGGYVAAPPRKSVLNNHVIQTVTFAMDDVTSSNYFAMTYTAS